MRQTPHEVMTPAWLSKDTKDAWALRRLAELNTSIQIERARQLGIGFTEAHDDEQGAEVLLEAGQCYIDRAILVHGGVDMTGTFAGPPSNWPWDERFWHPTDDEPDRMLIKGGALRMAAEQVRLRQTARDAKALWTRQTPELTAIAIARGALD